MRGALTSDDHPTLRLLGGVLFGVGAFVLLFRRAGPVDSWSEGARFLILWIPAVLLYVWGLAGARASAQPNAWQSAFTVFGLLLIPASLFLFVDWVGGSTAAPLNAVWIFGLSGVLGFAAGLAGKVRYCCLLGSLMLLIAWLSLWDEILSGGLGAHIDATRWLLLAGGIGLLTVAGAVGMRRGDGSAGDIVTAGGVALVAAGALTAFAILAIGFLSGPAGFDSSFFWDAELLVVSLALLAYGVGNGIRGTTYIAAFGLAGFSSQVGTDLTNPLEPGDIVGWPLALLVLGAIALAISIAPALRRSRA